MELEFLYILVLWTLFAIGWEVKCGQTDSIGLILHNSSLLHTLTGPAAVQAHQLDNINNTIN